ncbi:phytanoyl-CoA dioxygenase family protein [Mucilaginibacter sp. SP1R1]|uniref:phytanoyl-CoA dioxygenase family protein n=1 Tax=Mucilaginibacter sp. SP1R1 TaxID=2723091 RepID=UPI00161CD983|nr:phytanoyl-CoA dioxygenase family protein [Mucilaginibacter sp. SP1R1]MBB6150159.1 ectoine hydroxylase-related dioxygenase (phytanoyl-CoA dioxygenase family) [Mucilaginibacter sp. SP1R1]
MIPTEIPLLNSLINVDAAHISNFRQQGHVLIKNILQAPEVTYYREVIRDAVSRYNTETRAMQDRDTYSKAFLQIMNLWEIDEQVRQFTVAKRFSKIAADLLGVDHVRIYHDQALFKEAGGGFTPWHQDQYYWPLDTTQTVTMWMPLMDINVELGMLTFATGSHLDGFAENIPISDESETSLQKYIKQKKYPISRAETMQAGDATWHYGWTLHNAPGNSTANTTREVMTIIYYADGADVTQPQNKHQENDRQRWLGGLNPGQLANSNLNPLVY